MRAHLTVIERVTGHAPSTCPWRAFYEPIVREVLAVSWAVERGGLAAVIGTDPPYQLVQAVGVYERAFVSAREDERKLRHEEQMAEQRARRAAEKATGRRG